MSNELQKHFTQWMLEGFNQPEKVSNWSMQYCKPLKLGDGTVLSIQASNTHYCEPRINTPSDYSFYNSFEIGFPSNKINEILKYAEEPEEPCDTVYGYVPKEVIEEVINSRGGVVGLLTKDN